MQGLPKGLAAFALGACAGILVTIICLRAPSGRSVAPTEAESVVATADAIKPTGTTAMSAAKSSADAAHGATLAHVHGLAGGSSANSNHAADDSGYSFENELNAGRTHIKQRFDAEPEDGEWAPNAQSTLRASIDALPGRAIVANMTIECHSTLCSLTIVTDGPASSSDESNAALRLNLLMDNLQGDWAAKPPASDLFDDREVSFTTDAGTGRMTVEMFVHRRHQDVGTQAHSA